MRRDKMHDSDDELRKRGLAAQLRHGPGVGDPGRRVEIGEVETTSVGRVRAVHDQGADEAIIHGVHASLSEIAPDLRSAFIASSANFSEAENEQEQTTARLLVGLVV